MSEKFKCARCAADPQPKHFGSPRTCAFTDTGAFTPDNWNCATIGVLMGHMERTEHSGDDESMQVISVPAKADDGYLYTCGWIVLAGYKHRGCDSSAMHVGDFWPAEPLTLALADRVIALYEAERIPAISDADAP